MDTLSFKQLPLVVKIAVGVVFYNAWSHIFTLLGLWQEAIDSNLAAEKLAREQGGIQRTKITGDRVLGSTVLEMVCVIA